MADIKKPKYNSSYVMILRGRLGKKIFDQIDNGPRIPYERLQKESDAIKKQILEERKKATKNPQNNDTKPNK